MNNNVSSFIFLAVALFVSWPAAVRAHETDQFSNRTDSIADSTDVLNHRVNKAIARVVKTPRKDDDRMAFVNAMFRKLGSRLLVDRIEKWAIKSPEVEKLKTGRYDSIYSGHPLWAGFELLEEIVGHFPSPEPSVGEHLACTRICERRTGRIDALLRECECEILLSNLSL